MIPQVKKFYFKFVVPPLRNTLMFDFRATLSQKEYIIFWLSIIIFYILTTLTAYKAISFTRWIFRVLFDVKYPKWDIGHLETFFIFGCVLFITIFIVPFFVTTANRFKNGGIKIYFLAPLLILFWLWSVNLFQFGILPNTNAPLFYKAISILLLVYFIAVSILACLLPTKNKQSFWLLSYSKNWR